LVIAETLRSAGFGLDFFGKNVKRVSRLERRSGLPSRPKGRPKLDFLLQSDLPLKIQLEHFKAINVSSMPEKSQKSVFILTDRWCDVKHKALTAPMLPLPR